MKPKAQIKTGCAVRKFGETEVGFVVFLDENRARVDYLASDGTIQTAYVPLGELEVVLPAKFRNGAGTEKT